MLSTKRLPDLRGLLREGKPQTPQDHVEILSKLGLPTMPRLNVPVRG